MPAWGASIFHAVIFFGALFVGIRGLFDSYRERERERYAALLAITAMGIVFLRYYPGRSMPLQLVFSQYARNYVCGTAVRSMAVAGAFGRVCRCRVWRLAIGAPLLSAMVLYFANNPEPQRAWSVVGGTDPYPVDMAVSQIRAEFERSKRHGNDEILVVAPYAHLLLLELGKPSPLRSIGMCQIWFQDDIDTIVRTLHDPKIRMAVFDSNSDCNLRTDFDPAVAPILRDDFKPLSRGSLCSAASYRGYVRREGSVEDGQRVDGPDLALGKHASQSSEFGETRAAAAVDGNTDGRYEQHSVMHTALNTNAWWEVDLGTSEAIDSVVVWNRTDCCSERLKDYWVFVSDTPFGPADTPAALRNRAGTRAQREFGWPCPDQRIETGGFRGRYVRVQLSGAGYLSLAEVQVFGTPAGNKERQCAAADLP